jgi:hypothetical protein
MPLICKHFQPNFQQSAFTWNDSSNGCSPLSPRTICISFVENDKEGDKPEDKENNKVIACQLPKTIESGNCFCYFGQQGLDGFSM